MLQYEVMPYSKHVVAGWIRRTFRTSDLGYASNFRMHLNLSDVTQMIGHQVGSGRLGPWSRTAEMSRYSRSENNLFVWRTILEA